MKKQLRFLFYVIIALLIGILGFVLAAQPIFKENTYNVTYYFDEDALSYFNFSANFTNREDIVYYSIFSIR